MYIASIAAFASILVTRAVAGKFTPKTAVSIDGMSFRINGKLTYEGLNPEANADSFINSMDEYRAIGVPCE